MHKSIYRSIQGLASAVHKNVHKKCMCATCRWRVFNSVTFASSGVEHCRIRPCSKLIKDSTCQGQHKTCISASSLSHSVTAWHTPIHLPPPHSTLPSKPSSQMHLSACKVAFLTPQGAGSQALELELANTSLLQCMKGRKNLYASLLWICVCMYIYTQLFQKNPPNKNNSSENVNQKHVVDCCRYNVEECPSIIVSNKQWQIQGYVLPLYEQIRLFICDYRCTNTFMDVLLTERERES